MFKYIFWNESGWNSSHLKRWRFVTYALKHKHKYSTVDFDKKWEPSFHELSSKEISWQIIPIIYIYIYIYIFPIIYIYIYIYIYIWWELFAMKFLLTKVHGRKVLILSIIIYKNTNFIEIVLLIRILLNTFKRLYIL
jgi:hypothetical protein